LPSPDRRKMTWPDAYEASGNRPAHVDGIALRAVPAAVMRGNTVTARLTGRLGKIKELRDLHAWAVTILRRTLCDARS
jgi:hypothetical protein